MQGISRKEVLILVAMAAAVLMDGIDASIVNVALPTIASDFGTDVGLAAWITIIYFMMIAGLMLPFGRIADSGHIRKVFIVGFILFTASSLACGMSVSFGMLCASRVVQGVGAAMLGAAAPMMCVKFIPAKNLGFSLGILTLASAVGLAAGPALGGIMTEFLSWHWAFLINIPIGIAAVAFGLKVIPKDTPVSKGNLDLRGAVLLFVAIVAGVLAMESFDDAPVALMSAAVSVMSLVGFVFAEKRCPTPLLKMDMFGNRRLDLLLVSYLTINLAYYGIIYLLPFYLDIELGLDSATSGLILLIPPVITLFMCTPVGKACDLHGRRPYAIAASIVQVGYCVAFVLLRPEWGLLPLIPIAVAMGVVWGLCGASSSSRIVDSVPEEEKGIGSTLMNFVMYMSGTVGTAMFAVLMTFGAGSGDTPIDQLSPAVFMDGFTFSMLFAVLMAVIALVTAWAVNEKRDAARQQSR